MQNENIHKLLAQARNVVKTGEGSWNCYCPIHESGPGLHTNSLSVQATDDGAILVNCHNQCDAKDVVYAFGLTWKDCFPPKDKSTGSKITAVYDYFDEDGILRFQVCRIEPGKEGRSKDFRQRQPDGNGGWTWKTKGLRKFLYRLPELQASSGPVVVAEGEKAVDYLRSLGITATCNPGGAGKWAKSYAKYLSDRDVVIVPDTDAPNPKTGLIVGAAHARDIADSLIGVAKSIHVIELPDCQPKWGLDDWLQKGGHTLQEFNELCKSAQEWTPESVLETKIETEAEKNMADPINFDKKLLADIGISYVAQHPGSTAIEIFSECTQRYTTIRDPSAVRYEQFVLSCGHIFRTKVRRNADDTGDYSLSEVKIAVASVASLESVHKDKIGAGIWDNNGSLVVVRTKRLGILNCQPELQVTSSPVYLGNCYDIGDDCDWVDIDRLKDDIASVKAQPGQLNVDSVFELQRIFSMWNFANKAHAWPEVLTGMVLATFVQTVWKWRPQIFVTGQSNSGKTTMFKTIAQIFGPLCSMSSNSSAAGLRQHLGKSARIMLCDELEKSRHRPDILEMIRASGRGDDSFRGSASHSSVLFKLQHIFWCASIETGLLTEADQSRFIVCELASWKDTGSFSIPSNDALLSLGQRIVSSAMCSVRLAQQYIPVLLANRIQGVHNRVCESYSVPVAMYAAAIGFSQSEAVKLYQRILNAVIFANEDVESDSESLLQEILLTPVQIQGGRKKSALNMIRDNLSRNHEEDLQNVGIYLTTDHLYINRTIVAKTILGPDWRTRRIDNLLGRLPGAKRVMKRFGKSVLRFIEIPRVLISSIEIEDPNYQMSFEEEAVSDPFSNFHHR